MSLLHHCVLLHKQNTTPPPTPQITNFFTPPFTVGDWLYITVNFDANNQLTALRLGGVDVTDDIVSIALNGATQNIVVALTANAQSGTIEIDTLTLGTISTSGFVFFTLPQPSGITPNPNEPDFSFSWSAVPGADYYEYFATPENGTPSSPIGTPGSPITTVGLSAFSFTSFTGWSWTLGVRARKNNGESSAYQTLYYVQS